ncbi:hypothetical protein [Streptomyces panaciradicis]|uniref:hypothetical protein n=1 Tax=Streptomyces panaciradicis TaxID=1470261 RepID=UPI00201D0EC9|nr:hypothetical protein [Streptomyces panaciradicis]MCL6669251.1 hypothetical protein [Streptomyces panaciradicis]
MKRLSTVLPVTALTLAVVLGTAGPSNAATTYETEVTAFAAGDNDPVGGAIAYPGSAPRHSTAGGVGTYDDPITVAAYAPALPVGTRIYLSYVKKYFIMEDLCGACRDDWNRSGTRRVDIWIGYYAGTSAELCESRLTLASTSMVVDPDRGLPVDTTPLLGPNGCYL